MSKPWFGWSGLVGLTVFISFLIWPGEMGFAPYNIASITLLSAMMVSIIFPAIESARSSKWWLVVFICGLSAALRFFWVLAD
jgi:hypothetical protein